MSEPRLLVVSNRLPVTLRKTDGRWQASRSSGGLASAMTPILEQHGGIWIGSSGEEEEIDPAERARLLNKGAGNYCNVPVEMTRELASSFYEGYPNQAVWPLFHLFPSRMVFTPEAWQSYEEGNRQFANTIVEQYQTGDLIWVHDYHLMLLPAMLRERLPDARIGFFLHIPFPPSEVVAMLPRREEVLRGLLGADLIAFQTYRHLHHFRASVLRMLALASGMDRVQIPPRTIYLRAMPIGIAPGALTTIDADEALAALESSYADQHLIVSVDRLDYTKGIPERLKAFRRLLRTNPALAGKVTLIQVAVPSRENIESYQDLRSEVNELVGEINGKLGTSTWTPVVYMNRSITRQELIALYRRADAAWVTPLHDGMNLVAKEYCACKPDGQGVLVLSEFAGAAAELGEALLVNPYDEERVADTIFRALTMTAEERVARMKALNRRVLRNTVFRWAENFVGELGRAEIKVQDSLPKKLCLNVITSAYRNSADRVLLLDYDGTLASFVGRPEWAAPKPPLLDLLRRLTSDPANSVALVSGRISTQLDRWFGSVPGLILAAEHGAKFRKPGEKEWQTLHDAPTATEWKNKVRPILEHFADRTPGSLVEEKEYSIAWHYRTVEAEFGEWLAGELMALLGGMLADTDARPVHGHKVVEIRPTWAHKGELTSWMLAHHPGATFHLAAGDDLTDEDMFLCMPEGSWTIHVGTGATHAAYQIASPAAMVKILSGLNHAPQSQPVG